jgi:hypothetical protein
MYIDHNKLSTLFNVPRAAVVVGFKIPEEKLKSLGYEQIESHSYPSEHTVAPMQIRDLGAFIARCFGVHT